MVEEKGIDTLLSAYQRYREASVNPWALVLCGGGPELTLPVGAKRLPFAQPADLPQILEAAGAFVLPSIYEPWGVALHEAAAAGLPILASDAAGSGDAFLVPNENGHVHAAGDARGLAADMHRLTEDESGKLPAFSAASRQLGLGITPAGWAKYVLDGPHIG
jgi:glycosyltransferase involved in cell wall biosynthesis